ncbi:MAG: thiamine phosphate synthase [Phycisphaeraceae bacterium]
MNVKRILDANANRAREALRVMEEAARFLLDDPELSRLAKQARHQLAEALAELPGLEAARDTPGDVGTRISTAREAARESVSDVVIAAGKRLSEALRTLEEYGKTLPQADLAAKIEQIRYRGYDLEKRLSVALGTGRRQQWRLCVLLSESLCAGRDWREVATAAIAGGADCIQLREKALEAGELLQRTRELAEICHAGGVSLIVNDRPDVALLGGADGVHVGQGDLPCAEVRKLVGRQLLVGVSTSRFEQAREALAQGADYCGVGPMFPTTTKEKKVIVGPAYLREFTAWGRLPHLAIGGITPERTPELAAAGGRGVAVSSCVCRADDPAETCRKIVAALG